MPKVKTSCGGQALNIIENSLNTVSQLNQHIQIKSRLDELAVKTNSLISLLYSYTLAKSTDIDTDDEILNWTIPDVADELCASIWNLSSGFYKTAASSLRGALEMGIVSLYFQICENENTAPGYNEEFANWDDGDSSTPNWGITKPKIKQSINVKDFINKYGYCPIDKAHQYFKYLCNFTHSRSYSPEDGKETNSMNMKNTIGFFQEEEFLRISEEMDNTIAMIASTWSIIYPHIVEEWTDESSDTSFTTLDKIFSTKHAKKSFDYVKSKSSVQIG